MGGDPGTTGDTTAMIVLGVLLALASLWSLAMPGSVISEWTNAVLGALIFISPWVFGYADQAGAAWSSWIVGAIALIAGLWAVPTSQQAHQRLAHQ